MKELIFRLALPIKSPSIDFNSDKLDMFASDTLPPYKILLLNPGHISLIVVLIISVISNISLLVAILLVPIAQIGSYAIIIFEKSTIFSRAFLN